MILCVLYSFIPLTTILLNSKLENMLNVRYKSKVPEDIMGGEIEKGRNFLRLFSHLISSHVLAIYIYMYVYICAYTNIYTPHDKLVSKNLYTTLGNFCFFFLTLDFFFSFFFSLLYFSLYFGRIGVRHFLT